MTAFSEVSSSSTRPMAASTISSGIYLVGGHQLRLSDSVAIHPPRPQTYAAAHTTLAPRRATVP